MAQSTYTKRDVALMALEEIALARYVFDGTAEEDISALRRMDAMMASAPWSAVTYLQPLLSGQSLPSDLIGIDESYLEGIVTNLAVRIAPTYGKTVSPETRAAASRGYIAASAAYATGRILERVLNSNVIRGQGNRYGALWADPFFRVADDTAPLNALSLSTYSISVSI